jgi:hypothetical protein
MDCTNSHVQAIMTRGLGFEAILIVGLLMVGGSSPCGAQHDGEPSVSLSTEQPCSEAARLPDTIHVTKELRAPLQRMLKTSPTFRRQCRKIADAPRVYVRVRLDWRIDPHLFRARSTIHRSRVGALIALVEIGVHGNTVELIAHEFEHLVEQIEGVRLAELSERTACAWRSHAEMFETARAIRAGRTVMDEVRAADRFAAVLDARSAISPQGNRLVR